MQSELIRIIREQTSLLLANAEKTLEAADDRLLAEICTGIPFWQHFYHMLHSLDQWLINPSVYTEPRFHITDANSLKNPHSGFLPHAVLNEYFGNIRKKIEGYLSLLTDTDLLEKPELSDHTRLSLILAQSRHFMYHIGFIHSCIKSITGKWPEYIGIAGLKK
jgi:hypothetical protein